MDDVRLSVENGKSPCSAASGVLEFEDYKEAEVALKTLGYLDTGVCSGFSSTELVARTNELLRKSADSHLLDYTSALPDTASANWHALTMVSVNAGCIAHQSGAAGLLLRTRANTPCFVVGHHWNASQTRSVQEASETALKRAAPAGLLILKSTKTIELPNEMQHAPLDVAARILAALLDTEGGHYSCDICGSPLWKITEEEGLVLKKIASNGRGNFYSASCIAALQSEDLSHEHT